MKRLTSLTVLALALTLGATAALADHATHAAAAPAAKATAVSAPAPRPAPSGPAKPTTPPVIRQPSAPMKPTTPPVTTSKPAGGKTTTPPAAVTEAMKVDLNTATREDLMRIPGIGEATVTKILGGRPFHAKSDLLAKRVVNQAQYAKLAPYVIAKQK
jgi:competence protein ComEA